MSEEMEKLIYEYCTLRYVPDIERGEFVNIGLLMMCKRQKWIKSDIRIPLERIHHIFPNSDINTLQTQIAAYRYCDIPAKDLHVEERYRWMSAVKSAIIQTSSSHPGIIFCSKGEEIESLESKFTNLTLKLL